MIYTRYIRSILTHQLLKTFIKLYYRYKDFVYEYNSAWGDLIKKDIFMAT